MSPKSIVYKANGMLTSLDRIQVGVGNLRFHIRSGRSAISLQILVVVENLKFRFV